MGKFSNKFRTCQTTGLKVYLPAQRLMWAHAVSAVVFLLIGGIMALLIVLTRWPAVHLLPQDLFYRFVTAHGTDMLVMWIVFFEIAGLIFSSTAVLNNRYPAIKFGWFNYFLMLIGAVMVNVMIFAGKADVMFTAYPPLKAHPLFYLGIILFAVGALLSIFQFFYALVVAKKEGYHKGSLPLFTYGLVAAAVIGVWTLLSGAITFVPTLFWSMGWIDTIDPAFYRIAFWGFGHSAQQINLCATVAIWYLLANLSTGATPVNQKLCRAAFIMYVLGINLGSIHHLLVDPGLSSTYRIFNTSYLFYIAVLASLIHAYSIPSAIEVAQRKKGLSRGLFEWLTKAPWGNPTWSGLVISMLIFGFFGGVTGVLLSVEQLNMVSHNTMRVPGHFHAIVVGGTTLAFMVLTYILIPLAFQRKLIGEKLTKYQPYVFGLGITLLGTGMHFAGVMGAPRRHWDVTMQNAIFQVPFDSSMYTMLGLMGIGGIIAFIGLLMYIYVAVMSVFFGEKIPPKMEEHNPAHAVTA